MFDGLPEFMVGCFLPVCGSDFELQILARWHFHVASKQNRTEQSKIEFTSTLIKVSRGVQTESKNENRNPGEKQRAQPTWAVRNCAHTPAIY